MENIVDFYDLDFRVTLLYPKNPSSSGSNQLGKYL